MQMAAPLLDQPEAALLLLRRPIPVDAEMLSTCNSRCGTSFRTVKAA
jgi:hypothetical protein